jgi:hypothetical protein
MKTVKGLISSTIVEINERFQPDRNGMINVKREDIEMFMGCNSFDLIKDHETEKLFLRIAVVFHSKNMIGLNVCASEYLAHKLLETTNTETALHVISNMTVKQKISFIMNMVILHNDNVFRNQKIKELQEKKESLMEEIDRVTKELETLKNQ